MQLNVLTIVGVGLIGGSIGLAAKRRGVARCVRGLGRSRTSLERALTVGAIDEVHLDEVAAMAGADLVVVCTPVDQIADQIVRFAPLCKAGSVLTDAGSTKGMIVNCVGQKLRPPPCYVGSHPLAGSEKRGPEHADANLFDQRWAIVTPAQHTPSEATERVVAFWRALGSRVRIMSPADHDRVVAATSHVPHLMASALAGSLPPEYREFAASGFLDTTRIAAGDPDLWTAIFFANRTPLLHAITQFTALARQFRTALEARDEAAVRRLLQTGKEVRDALGN